MTTDVATAVASLEETTYTYSRPQGTTSELDIPSPRSWAGKPIIEVFLMFICLLAFIANLAMLICLLVYKQATRKTVNIFVCNQTILDLVASSFFVIKVVLLMSGYLHTKTGVQLHIPCFITRVGLAYSACGFHLFMKYIEVMVTCRHTKL